MTSLFLPDCGKVSDVYVILKPKHSLYAEEVTKLFERLGYKIIDKKQTQLPDEKLRLLLEMLERDGRPEEITHDLVREWQYGEFILFNLVKPAGKKEMLSILSKMRKWSMLIYFF